VDILSLIGLFVGIAAIVGGNALEGGHFDSLLQFTALVIVLGGTFGAIMLQTPLPVFLRALKSVPQVFVPPRIDAEEAIGKIIKWSNVARKEGLLGLEPMAQTERDDFARKGLQLLVDGTEPDAIRSILEVELDAREHYDAQAAKVFEGMGGYSPTIGIIGAVMGLIHVMQNLTDPSKLGAGIAVAFVATIYGVGLANLVFLPVGNKLKAQLRERSQFREMIIEGIVSISNGENPRSVESRLQGYLH
jgi:chemotaxis protein MotA